MAIFILNGPNLNRLGTREPEIYGSDTLADIEAACRAHLGPRADALQFRQSNHEGVLVDWIQEAEDVADGLIINPGAYTHTSIALRDALLATAKPKIELHLSNLHKREPFRRRTHVGPAVDGAIYGFGAHGYLIALDALGHLIDKREN